jgi:hypothetical protein
MASKGRPGMHYRRGGWVKNPTPKKKSGAWIAAAVVVVLLYGWLNGCINGDPKDDSSPKPASSSSENR